MLLQHKHLIRSKILHFYKQQQGSTNTRNFTIINSYFRIIIIIKVVTSTVNHFLHTSLDTDHFTNTGFYKSEQVTANKLKAKLHTRTFSGQKIDIETRFVLNLNNPYKHVLEWLTYIEGAALVEETDLHEDRLCVGGWRCVRSVQLEAAVRGVANDHQALHHADSTTQHEVCWCRLAYTSACRKTDTCDKRPIWIQVETTYLEPVINLRHQRGDWKSYLLQVIMLLQK